MLWKYLKNRCPHWIILEDWAEGPDPRAVYSTALLGAISGCWTMPGYCFGRSKVDFSKAESQSKVISCRSVRVWVLYSSIFLVLLSFSSISMPCDSGYPAEFIYLFVCLFVYLYFCQACIYIFWLIQKRNSWTVIHCPWIHYWPSSSPYLWTKQFWRPICLLNFFFIVWPWT